MRTTRCEVCAALVREEDGMFHREWHYRLERAVRDIPEPPPMPMPL